MRYRRHVSACVATALLLAACNLVSQAANPPAAAAASRADDIAGNEEVRRHIETFKGRGQTVEAGGGAPALSPAESRQRFKLPPDLEMTLAVSEPDVRQPVCLNFDERGRLWVVQYLQYPFPAGLKVIKYDEHLRAVFDRVPAAPPNHVPGADKVTIYEDKDGDGYFETHRDFVTGLNIATSALPGRGGVWVMNPPYLLFYPDRNGDDTPDGPPEVRLSGFGLEDTHAVANSLTWGPDGWLYGAQGSTCTATVKGIRFLGQAIWRYRPETGEFEVFAEGGGNTFAVEFDAEGRLYSGTNWGDQRGLLFVQGGYYVKNWGKHGPLTNPHAYGFFPHMTHDGDEARFSHSFVIYEGDALPAKYLGKMFAIVPLQNRVQVAELRPDGSTFKTHDTERAVETDDKWFRPVDIKAGPDGALYLADWYDVRLTHVDPRDNWDRSNGRIWRLGAKGAKAGAKIDLAKLSSERLAELLAHSNKWHRQTALRLLGDRRDAALVPALSKRIEADTGRAALEALWALHLCGGFTEAVALRSLGHRDAQVRLWTIRLLGDAKQVSPKLHERLLELARYEPDVLVRSQLASSAKRLPGPDALPLVQVLAQREDAADPHVPLLLWWALEPAALAQRAEVLARFNTAAAWQQPIVARHLLPRLAQRYAAEGTAPDLDAVAALMDQAPGLEAKQRLLAAVAEAYKGRRIENPPAALRRAIAAIGGPDDPARVLLRLRLGVGTETDAAFALKFIRNDEEKIKAQRIDFIQALGEAGERQAVDPLLDVARASRWHSVRRAALQALQHFAEPRVGAGILAAYDALPPDQGVRPTALSVLSKRREWSLALLQAVERDRIRRTDVPFEVVERLKLYPDVEAARLVQKLWGNTRPSPEEKQRRLGQAAKVLAGGGGDAARGRQLFATACATCHKLHGEGQSIGPDLTGYERDNLDFLLLAIVDPSAGIREEYTNFELETTDGLLLTGFITERAAQSVTIEDGEQGRVTVPKTRIKTLQASAVSRMPEGLLDALDEQQVRDLFAYLRGDRNAKAGQTSTPRAKDAKAQR